MGTLLIDSGAPSFEDGVAHVWIEAPAPADAPAPRLAETRVEGIVHRSGVAEEVAFAIEPPAGMPPNARLRAWLDVAGRGAPGSDDLFSTEATTVSGSRCVLRVERSGR